MSNLPALYAVNPWFMAALGTAVALGAGLLLTALVQSLLTKVATDAINTALGSVPGGSSLLGNAGSLLTPDLLKLFAVEHGVPLVAQVSASAAGASATGSISLIIPITGLLLVPALALLVGGYVSASSDFARTPGSSVGRGSLVGLLYGPANGALALMSASHITSGLAGVGGDLVLGPSPVAALLYGLLWGCLFGAVGGWIQYAGTAPLSTIVATLQAAPRRGLASALAGAFTALTCGILICVALVTAALSGLLALVSSSSAPNTAVGSGDIFQWGLALLGFVVLAPAAAIYVFTLAYGVNVDVHAPVADAPGSAVQSLGLLTHSAVGPLPAFVFVIALVPVVAFFVGGRVAARVDYAEDTSAGFLAGARMALPLSAMMALLAFLSSLSLQASASGQEVSIGVSLSLLGTLIVTLIGSAVVGGIGGLSFVLFPALDIIPRLLALPFLPFEFILFPILDSISDQRPGRSRTAAQRWVYDAGIALAVLAGTSVALRMVLAQSASANTLVTALATIAPALTVGLPILFLTCALITAVMSGEDELDDGLDDSYDDRWADRRVVASPRRMLPSSPSGRGPYHSSLSFAQTTLADNSNALRERDDAMARDHARFVRVDPLRARQRVVALIMISALVLAGIYLFTLFGARSDWAGGAFAAGIAAFVMAGLCTALMLTLSRRTRRLSVSMPRGAIIPLVIVLVVTGLAGVSPGPILHKLQAQNLEGSGRWAEAIDEYSFSGEHAPQAPDIARVHVEWGDTLSAQRHFEAASDQYLTTIDTYFEATAEVQRALSGMLQNDRQWLDSAPALTDTDYDEIASGLSAMSGARGCDAGCATAAENLEAETFYRLGTQAQAQGVYSVAVESFQSAERITSSPFARKARAAAASSLHALGRSQIATDCAAAVNTFDQLVSGYADTPDGASAKDELSGPVTVTGTVTNYPYSSSPAYLSRTISPLADAGVHFFSDDYFTTLDATDHFAFTDVTPGDYNLSVILPDGFPVWWRSVNPYAPYTVHVHPLCPQDAGTFPYSA